MIFLFLVVTAGSIFFFLRAYRRDRRAKEAEKSKVIENANSKIEN